MVIMCLCFLFNDTATTEIYTYLHTLSLHDALPISSALPLSFWNDSALELPFVVLMRRRSEEHTSELQSLMRISYAVFCLKKKKLISQLPSYLILLFKP